MSKKIKLSAVIKSTGVPASLVRAVVRQFGGWDSFQESADDIANHGAASGWSGFTWYTETRAFTARNRAAIVEMAESQARDLGERTAIGLVSSFREVRDSDATPGEVGRVLYSARGGDDDARTMIENTLAWYALEEVARAVVDFRESVQG
jgi:hypothetical protein